MKIRPVLVAAFAVAAMGLLAARAQERIEIFDAHLHYNQEPTPFYTLEQVRKVFRRNGASSGSSPTADRTRVRMNSPRRNGPN
jgi:hypothetical protein